jgi:hypothetical protein
MKQGIQIGEEELIQGSLGCEPKDSPVVAGEQFSRKLNLIISMAWGQQVQVRSDNLGRIHYFRINGSSENASIVSCNIPRSRLLAFKRKIVNLELAKGVALRTGCQRR